MSDEGSSERTLTIPQAAELRGKTEAISKRLQSQLEGHLETLRPLLAARRLLGKYLGGSAARDEVAGAEKAVEQLEKQFKEVAGPPFVLRPELRREWLTAIENRVELYPWEYDHEASHGDDTRTISITSPVRWVMTYGSDYTFSQVRRVLKGELEKRPDDLARFLVSALVMRAMIEKFPALKRLLADLRFDVEVEAPTGMGKLPVVVVSSNLSSFRPADELILTATGFSGVAAFIELVDRDAVANLRDPLREQLEEALS
jgi:hypothetical protein